MRTPQRLLPVALAAFALVLSGCSGDSVLPSDEELAEKSGGNPDRPFGSTDEAVVTAVVSAVKAEKAERDGTVLRVYVDGSADAPTAGLYCSSINGLIADDEQGVFVYPDGEFDCEERR